MNNRKTTKRALWSSVVSLLLCFAMLMGTTYAWFTDSVTSANNVIKSGNLDIELEYLKNGEWVDVKDASDILTNELWEPGVTEVAYFRIANAGSLALKYQFGINIVSETAGKNVAGETFKLSDYIQFGVVEGVNGKTDAYDNREAAVAAVTEAKKISAGYTKAAAMEHDTEIYLALVVYMPTTVGNEANHNGTDIPQIDLGINIFATQAESEEDGFGTDYDADAWMPEMQVYTAEDLQAALGNAVPGVPVVLMNDIVIDGDLVIPTATASTYSMRAANDAIVVNLNGYTLSAGYVTTEGKAIIANGKLVMPENGYVYTTDGASIVLEDVQIESDGISAYAAVDGILALKNVTFVNTATSNPIQNYGGSLTLDNVTVAQQGDAATAWYSSAVQVINLIVKNEETGKYEITAQANTTINSGVYEGKTALFVSAPGGNVTINGGTFTGSEYAINAQFSPQNYTYGADYESVITITGGTFTGALKFFPATEVIITGGVFSHDPSAYVAEGYKAVETPKGWEIIPADSNYVADGVLVSTDGKTYYISNANGYAWVEAQADDFFGNKTIALTADIDFGGATIPSIGFWNSHPTFDGQGYTLSNFVIAQSGLNSSSGLFAGTFNVQNVNVDNASVKGTYAGVISGWMYGNIDNCTVKNSIVTTTYWQAGGLVGQYNAGNVTNCTVENTTVIGGAAVGALIGILNETTGVRKVENCTVDGCVVVMQNNFGGVYDEMFGAVVGLINVENSKIYFNDCTITDTTVKGVASSVLFGRPGNNEIYVDGATAVYDEATLKAALATGKSVVLVNDITVVVADTGFEVGTGINAKLDLNGYNITATSTSAESVQLFYVEGNLEIVGKGTISLTNDNYNWSDSYRYTAINIREAGVVTLGEGVSVVCETYGDVKNGMCYAVDIYHEGVLNVNGASLHSNYIAVRCFFGASVVNVNSGSSITSSKNNWGIWPQSATGAQITIADGIAYTTDSYGIYIFG